MNQADAAAVNPLALPSTPVYPVPMQATAPDPSCALPPTEVGLPADPFPRCNAPEGAEAAAGSAAEVAAEPIASAASAPSTGIKEDAEGGASGAAEIPFLPFHMNIGAPVRPSAFTDSRGRVYVRMPDGSLRRFDRLPGAEQ